MLASLVRGDHEVQIFLHDSEDGIAGPGLFSRIKSGGDVVVHSLGSVRYGFGADGQRSSFYHLREYSYFALEGDEEKPLLIWNDSDEVAIVAFNLSSENSADASRALELASEFFRTEACLGAVRANRVTCGPP